MPAKNSNKIHGTIISFSEKYGYGFIREEAVTDKSKDRFFHKKHIIDGTKAGDVKPGQEVDFNLSRVKENKKGMCAVNIEFN